MKLSGKGLSNVFYHQSLDLGIDSYDFKPEDFTGAVVLTVEEAEKLMKLLDLCECWLTNNNVSYDCDAWASLLEERIEQAEKQK